MSERSGQIKSRDERLQSSASVPIAGCPAAPFSLADTETFPLFDRSGSEYAISVAHPRDKDAQFRPVIFLLDANASFATMVEAVRLRGSRPDVSGVVPAWVVGIGYPTSEPLDMVRRSYDYTPPTPELVLPKRPDGSPWPRMGGADQFISFVGTVLQPELDRRHGFGGVPRTIFGHSFGALCVLHMLFTRPAMFDKYIAASPSIWWNDRYILKEERAFVAHSAHHERQKALFLMSGSDENRGPFADDNADSVRDMADRLKEVSTLRVRHHQFQGEDHGSMLPGAISRAVTFACGRD